MITRGLTGVSLPIGPWQFQAASAVLGYAVAPAVAGPRAAFDGCLAPPAFRPGPARPRTQDYPLAESALIDNDFVAAVRRDMLKFAKLQLRDAALAEDAVQEALVAALVGNCGFSGRSALKTWVFSILRNKIVDLIRQQSRYTNISALSQVEAGLDETFETLFKANAH